MNEVVSLVVSSGPGVVFSVDGVGMSVFTHWWAVKLAWKHSSAGLFASSDV